MNRADVAPFGGVAKGTGEGEVVGRGRTAMFLTDDMIHLATETSVHFGDQTVFAQPVGAGDHGPSHLCGYMSNRHVMLPWRAEGERVPWPGGRGVPSAR